MMDFRKYAGRAWLFAVAIPINFVAVVLDILAERAADVYYRIK